MTDEIAAMREFAVLSGAVSTAMIETADGPIPLDWIACGDRVMTRDAGYQPVRWVARTPLDIPFLRAYPEVSPITVPVGSFAPNSPAFDLVLSPSQLVPLVGVDGTEMLVTADVVGDPIYPEMRARTERFTYVNVLLDTHQLVMVEGAWIGSLFTADLGNAQGGPSVMAPVAPIVDRTQALTLWAALPQAKAQRCA